MPDEYYNLSLTGNQVDAALSWTNTILSTGIPKVNLASDVQTSLGKADTALQTAPVTSVDGKTGAVSVLPGSGAAGQFLRKRTSEDYVVEWADVSGSVESVNGKTGPNVVLDASDVGALPDDTAYVSTVNGVSGAVTINAAGINAIPAPGSPNPGDVLTYANGAWTAAAPATELPSVTTTDNGKVLSVVQGAWAASTPDPGLPSVSSTDNGKVLKVVSGVWAAADMGAIPTPSTAPTTGQFLQWNGTAWVAASLPLYNGGVS